MTANFIIVDDDAINNMLCKLSIARHFGPVQMNSYQAPETALALIPELEEPTVLFLDLKMPQISGWEFLERMAQIDNNVLNRLKVFVLSSSTRQEDRERAESNPLVSGFISKPLNEKKLAEVFRLLPEDYGLRCFG
ncbi:MAG: response regulator [Flavobacterium sp.]|nr:MAG: response regulator [Flavobacterium sp.]